MSDKYCKVRIIDIFIHDYRVALRSLAKVYKMLVVLAVVVYYLPSVDEFKEELIS